MLRSLLFGGAALAALLPATALAQNAPRPAASVGIEELVVTARKTEERAQDVPVAITAISPTRIKDLSISNLSDVSRSTPNLFVTRYNSNPASPLITIRGQAQQDVILNIDSPVGVYVDGVYLPHSFGLDAAMVDVERIEVLKGPQGTLYGKNTTGGAISIVTKNPDLNEVGGFVDLTGGNYGYFGINAAVNVPLIQDKLGVRVVATNINHSAWGRDQWGGPVNDDHQRYYRAKLRWEPAENVHVLLSGDYQRLWNRGSAVHLVHVNDQPSAVPKTPANGAAFNEARAELGLANTPANLLIARNLFASYMYGAANGPKGFYDSSTFQPQEGHFDGYGFSADVGVDLTDDITVRSITAYRQFRRRDVNELDGTPYTILYSSSHGLARNFTEELQVSGRTEKLNWIIGGFGNIEYAHDYSIAVTTPAVNPNSPGYNDGYLKQTSWAIYGQAGYQLTEQLRVTGGLRWTSETKRNESHNRTGPLQACTIPVVLRVSPTVCQGNFQKTYDDYSYLLSVDYKPTEAILLYAKTSRGFKGGGQNIRGNTTVESFAPFAPETVTDYEVGVKADMLDRRLRVNAAAFHTRYKDIQRSARVLSAAGTSVSLLTNAARAEINGLELELTARPIPALTLNASAGITDPKYKDFIDATGDRSGEPFAFPEKTWSISGVYVAPIGDNSELRFAADYNWRDDVTFAPSAVFLAAATQKAYGIANARVAYVDSSYDLEVALFVKNLTKKKFYVASGTFDNSFGYDLLWPGAPRTYGIQLIKKFGGG